MNLAHTQRCLIKTRTLFKKKSKLSQEISQMAKKASTDTAAAEQILEPHENTPHNISQDCAQNNRGAAAYRLVLS